MQQASTPMTEIRSLAARYRLPAVYPFRFFVEFGGLLSYGNDINDSFRRAATYADRILKGATIVRLGCLAAPARPCFWQWCRFWLR
jgi:hypothetical protein